jgi:hypothetical protein
MEKTMKNLQKIIFKYFLTIILTISVIASAMVTKETGKPEAESKPKLEKLEAFKALPTDIKVLIIGAINEGSFDATIKKLAKLREVNKEFRNIINDPTRGKALFQMIVSQYPYTDATFIISAALDLDTLGSFQWIKDKINTDENVKALLNRGLLNLSLRKIILEDSTPETLEKKLHRAQKLLSLGADPNAIFIGTLMSALMSATQLQDIEFVKLLLDAGANINYIQPGKNKTATDIAISTHNNDLIRLLFSRGGKMGSELQAEKNK